MKADTLFLCLALQARAQKKSVNRAFDSLVSGLPKPLPSSSLPTSFRALTLVVMPGTDRASPVQSAVDVPFSVPSTAFWVPFRGRWDIFRHVYRTWPLSQKKRARQCNAQKSFGCGAGASASGYASFACGQTPRPFFNLHPNCSTYGRVRHMPQGSKIGTHLFGVGCRAYGPDRKIP